VHSFLFSHVFHQKSYEIYNSLYHVTSGQFCLRMQLYVSCGVLRQRRVSCMSCGVLIQRRVLCIPCGVLRQTHVLSNSVVTC